MASHPTTYYSLAITTALAFSGIGHFAWAQQKLEHGTQAAHSELKAADAPPTSKVRQTSAEEQVSESVAGAVAADAIKEAPPAIAPISDAKRITELERATEDDEKRLTELKARLSKIQAEYSQAEAEFKKFDGLLEDSRSKLRKATAEADITRSKQTVRDLEPQWNRAKQRFDVELQERRMLNENITIVEQKLQSDRKASKKLTAVEQGTKASASPTGASQHAIAAPPGTSAPVASGPHDLPATEQKVHSKSISASNVALPLAPTIPTGAPTHGTPNAPATTPVAVEVSKTKKTPSKELVEATQVAEERTAEAVAAEDEARSITERISLLKKSIKMERELRDAERKKVDIADKTLKSLDAELLEKSQTHEQTQQLQVKVRETKRQLAESRDETRRVTTQLDKLQSELNSLQAEQLAALSQAEQKRTIAEKAAQKVKHLNNPFSARNLIQWSLDHGPRMFSILLAIAALLWISRMMQSRLVRLMVGHGLRGKREERENRARTLVSVFHNAANLLIIGGGGIMLLEETGVPVGPLVGGAAVVGLAIAFGAQSLIKDYFTGFILLLEQQYLINDVVRIGDVAGQVESISLRMTALRDLDGRVHFIPHGAIHSVTNLTHGWSRAVLEIGVAYKENIDRVIAVLNELGRELRKDEQFKKLILEDLTMLGVDALGDSAVVIKLFFKTEPLQQWTIKREFLRRVKNRFDELHIEIPFPHRTIYHRHDTSAKDHVVEAANSDGRKWATHDAA